VRRGGEAGRVQQARVLLAEQPAEQVEDAPDAVVAGVERGRVVRLPVAGVRDHHVDERVVPVVPQDLRVRHGDHVDAEEHPDQVLVDVVVHRPLRLRGAAGEVEHHLVAGAGQRQLQLIRPVADPVVADVVGERDRLAVGEDRGEQGLHGPVVPVQPAGHERPGDLQYLAEAPGGDQPDPGALALQDRVGRDRGPVQDLGDVGEGDPRRAAHLLDPAQHADGLVVRRGSGLGAVGTARPLIDQQHVGEGAADVDTEPVGHRASQKTWVAAVRSRRPRSVPPSRRRRGRAGRGRPRRCAPPAPGPRAVPARECCSDAGRHPASAGRPAPGG
jgi:hypothetical protein